MSIATALTELQSDITAARTAITTKGGTVTSGGGSSQLATDIATIPTGGGGGGWVRPTEWGEQDPAFVAEKAKPKEQQTMEALYLTYHHDDDAYGKYGNFAGFKITTSAGTYTVTRGHVANGAWVNDEVTSGIASGALFLEDFYEDDSVIEYPVYKIAPDTAGATINSFSYGASDGRYALQAVYEFYGRTKSMLVRPNNIYNKSYDVIIYGKFGSRQSDTFYNCHAEYINVESYDMSDVTYIYGFFRGCSHLKELNVSSWDVSSVTAMISVFRGCISLKKLDLSSWDVSSVTDINYMFESCSSLSDLNVSTWNTSSVKNMSFAFSACSSLKTVDLSSWDTSSVTNMGSMFNNCAIQDATDISNFDVSSVTNFDNMFSHCLFKKIDLSSWNTSSCTNFNCILSYNDKLEDVKLGGFIKSTYAGGMSLFDTGRIRRFDTTEFDTTSVTSCQALFRYAYYLEELDMTGNDFRNCTSFIHSFTGGGLVDFHAPIFYCSVNLQYNARLTHDSLMSVINNLATVSTTQTLTIGATNRAKLTAEEIAIATEKGWTVA